MKRTTRLAAEALPVVLALVLAACGGSDGADTTSTTPPEPTTTTMASATTAASTTQAPTTTSGAATTAGDLPTELTAGTYVVGTEILPGTWAADECGCPWAVVDAAGIETMGSGDDAIVPADAHAIRLGPCTWTFKG